MRIAMIGQKHYGSREGGIEVVVTELARRMAALGHEVTCYDRMCANAITGEKTDMDERFIDGVHVVPAATIDVKGLSALSSSYFATRRAIEARPDVIHYHAEGPCNALPFASRSGIRTIATVHSLDWKRAKWGSFASRVIKRGERVAVQHADELIVLSYAMQEYFSNEYGRDTWLVPNGVNVIRPVPACEIEVRWGLTEGTYILFVGRIVPEKRLELLLGSFADLGTDKRLVIAGGSSDTSAYFKRIEAMASRDPRVVMTGFVESDLLAELYSNAYCYVLPSDVEGMPVGLLEAMAFGRPCVISDIPESAEVLAGTGVVFPSGNVDGLRNALSELLSNSGRANALGEASFRRVVSSYDWESVVERTLAVYRGVV